MSNSKKGKNFSTNTNKNRPKSDFYQTPYSLTKLLLENENFNGEILEPCCGKGAITKVLKDFKYNFKDFDLEYGQDFLEFNEKVDNIITNPPYRLAKEFILHSFKITKNKIAMLLPLNYLHGKERFDEIYSLEKLETVYIFTRYPLLSQEIREDGKFKTGMMVYGWFIWNQNFNGNPQIMWLDCDEYVIKGKK